MTVNLIISPRDLAASPWYDQGNVSFTPTANAAAAPDGSITATQFAMGAVVSYGNYRQHLQNINLTAGNQVTFSVYLRSVSGATVYLWIYDGATNAPAVACTVTSVWQRFTLTYTGTTTGAWIFQIGNNRYGLTTSADTGAQTFLMWGAQVELSATATALVPVTAPPSVAPVLDVYRPRLAEYLREKPTLKTLLDTLGARSVALGTVGTQLRTLRVLGSATAAQLDVVGAVVGQARATADDATYSRLINARILSNRSSGTVDEIYAVLALALPAGSTFHLTDAFPAGFNFYADTAALSTADAYQAISFLAGIRSAAVRGLFFWRTATVPNTFTLDTALPAQSLDAGSFANAALYPGAL